MKNIEQTLILGIAILCVGLMFGILIGRFGTDSAVQLSEYDKSIVDQPTQTIPYQSDTMGKININTASVEEITMLPGIGETHAKRIVEYRQKHGPFLSIEEVTKVTGIGESRFESIEKYITVGG